MARKIIDPDEAAQPQTEDRPQGVVFVKNQVNEVIKFEDGTQHQFSESRTLVTDPELIDKLRQVAARPNNPYGIFESQS